MGLGILHIKGEGKPIHPDDLNYGCWCEKFQEHYNEQLRLYNKEYNIEE